MDFHSLLAIGLPVGLAITAVGSAFALGRVVATALEATARQPEASNKIMMSMIIGCAFIEALTIYVLVFGFIFGGKI